MGDVNEEKIDASKASVMGIISRDFLSRDVCQSNHVYSCLGHEVSPQTEDARKDGTGAVTSQWFQSMLSQLQKSNCIMILYLRKRLVVLEPLTSVLGSLRVLCSMSGKAKKKINAFDGVMSPPKMSCDEVSEEAGDEEGNILDELATHLQEETSQSKEEEEEATTDETSKECLLDLNFHKETNSLKSFTVSCLEPWYRDVPDRGVTAKFLERLVSLPENLLLDESINLSSALSQLKQLYKSGQNISSSQETEKKRTDKNDKSNKLDPFISYSEVVKELGLCTEFLEILTITEGQWPTLNRNLLCACRRNPRVKGGGTGGAQGARAPPLFLKLKMCPFST
ncbi:hypothetical protein BSL78_25864 [Apostichopus japonicus]|uniref:Uncharacterized protein n=1 Tax=Stichopus japonicus TaxID=307972 RepID=A0A2G8JNG1_STIJA|nr:hypothetical protein BSL78_25864 [Apostichopus japonicus]